MPKPHPHPRRNVSPAQAREELKLRLAGADAGGESVRLSGSRQEEPLVSLIEWVLRWPAMSNPYGIAAGFLTSGVVVAVAFLVGHETPLAIAPDQPALLEVQAAAVPALLAAPPAPKPPAPKPPVPNPPAPEPIPPASPVNASLSLDLSAAVAQGLHLKLGLLELDLLNLTLLSSSCHTSLRVDKDVDSGRCLDADRL